MIFSEDGWEYSITDTLNVPIPVNQVMRVEKDERELHRYLYELAALQKKYEKEQELDFAIPVVC